MIFFVIAIVALLIIISFCYYIINRLENELLYRERSTITQQLAKDLLNVTTDGPKELPFFSAGDKARIFDQWFKKGFIK